MTMVPAYIKYTDDMPAWMGGYANLVTTPTQPPGSLT
jgi:hypothetical protein